MKKEQVVFIHGGETFKKYGEYLEILKSWEYKPSFEIKKRWKNSLEERLGEKYEFHQPTMPCKYNAKYKEWKIWFEKVWNYLGDGVIFIGYSLGGTFLLKYLSELDNNKINKKVKAVILVAPAVQKEVNGYDLDTFVLDYEKVKKLDNYKITIYHSKDDPVVPYADAEILKNFLPKSELITFNDRGHFMMEEFSEIVEKIRGF